MTLNQILRLIRRQPAEPELSDSARAFIEAHKHDLDGWTADELDEVTRRSLEGHEDELRQAMRESDEMREWIRSHRVPTRREGLSKRARAYVESHKHSLEGWTDDEFLELERRSAAGRDAEIRQALVAGDEMREYIRLHRN